jgi:hypothetical protein
VQQGADLARRHPGRQRLLLSTKEGRQLRLRGSDMWSFDPLPRVVNNSRYGVLASLLDHDLLERLASQAALDGRTR